MATDLKRIGERARKDGEVVFTSLFHHVTDVDNLRACYEALPGDRATGVDGVTKKEYDRHLEDNLQQLAGSLRQLGYRPKPKRRVHIPKPGSAKGRPLGISCLDDKIVELAIKRVLEPIYETMFEESSFGYRPGRSQHQCLDALGRTIQQKRVNHVVEADIKSFFDEVNHKWMMQFLRRRIGDWRVLRVIWRMLKGGILEDGLTKATEAGTPQGSILSPLLSNIYLHYVLDSWYARDIRPHCRGGSRYIRFADDFLVCFQYQSDATGFMPRLQRQMHHHGLRLAEDKTQRIAFGRKARFNAAKVGTKPATFTFLGFTHYCGKTRMGSFKLKRRTSRKKMGQSLKEFGEWARRARCYLRKGDMIRRARAKVVGHLNYYAITDNTPHCRTYEFYAKHLLFKWLNRKSQRTTYTWGAFKHALAHNKWPRVLCRKGLNPFRRRRLTE